MTSEILDDIDLKPQKETNWKEFLVPGFLLIGGGYQIQQAFSFITIIEWISYLSLVISSLTLFRSPKLSLAIFTIQLIIWIFFRAIFPFIIYWSFELSIGDDVFGIDLMMLALFIIHCLLNKAALFPIVQEVLNNDEEYSTAAALTRQSGYKRRFKKKTNSELEAIIELNMLVPEAIQAAKDLINERQAENE